jgi:TatA/E family protein of Tat protein translocase
MPNIGAPELIIIFLIALLILGPGKLPEVGASLGKSIREFRKASTDVQDAVNVDTSPLPAAPAAQAPVAQAAVTPVATAPAAAPAAEAAPVAQAAETTPAATASAPTAPAPDSTTVAG